MATLTDAQKREIVEALACFVAVGDIIAHFRSDYGLELDHRQVGAYDPTRSYYEGGDKWREIFTAAREAHLTQTLEVPIANQGYRLQVMQRALNAAEKAKNWPLVSSLLEQAAKEVGGVLTNRRELKVDDKRARPEDMTPEERHMALAEIVRQALESAPARLAPPIEGEAREV